MSDSDYRQEYDEYQQGTEDADAELSADQAQYDAEQAEQQVPPDNDPGWVEFEPGDHLVHWAENIAPGAESWTWEGWGDGGYVLACYNALNWDGAARTVRFHLHPQGFHREYWNYGSMWIEGVDDLSINVNDDLQSRARLEPVATTLWEANAENRD